MKELDASEKDWWHEFQKDITKLRDWITGLQDKAFETSEERAHGVQAIESILNHMKIGVHDVAHSNGETISVVDDRDVGKVQVKKKLQYCIELIESHGYDVIQKSESDPHFGARYGNYYIEEIRMYKEPHERGKYQKWVNKEYVETIPEEEGELICEGTRLKDFSVVATIDDIFADIRDAVETMQDGPAKRDCQVSFQKTRQKFDEQYADSNVEIGWNWAYKVIYAFTQKIYQNVDYKNKNAKEVADFLDSYARVGTLSTYPIKWTVARKTEYLAEYYKKAPVKLKLAKMKRIAAEGQGTDPDSNIKSLTQPSAQAAAQAPREQEQSTEIPVTLSDDEKERRGMECIKFMFPMHTSS
jgi:hypothetical protein